MLILKKKTNSNIKEFILDWIIEKIKLFYEILINWYPIYLQITKFPVGRLNQEKETIVWCVGLLDDMTIITGDSR